MGMKGKWAQGIKPRNFDWVIRDRFAVCERPGGYGSNHRRVRRQEEIIWIRENGFGCVISLIPAPHNLHNYDELGVVSRHRPFNVEDVDTWLRAFYRELHELLRTGTKVIVHGGDRAEALARAREAVANFQVVGPKCNLPFFAELLENTEFITGDYDTGIVSRMR